MPRLCFGLLCGCALLYAQSPEEGTLTRTGNRMTLSVDSPRPLDSAAMTISRKFGLRICVEDPPYLFKDDIKDVTAEVSRVPDLNHRVLVPKGGRLEVSFPVRPDGSPEDVQALLQDLIVTSNAQYPFAYRLDRDGGLFTLVPTRTRDRLGQGIPVMPLLDRRVTIPPGTRTVMATAQLMSGSLSSQTGLHVSCCQAFVAGVPWGMTIVTFEAHDESARSVLTRLIEADLGGHPNPYFWLQRCDPLPSAWCFINLEQVR